MIIFMYNNGMKNFAKRHHNVSTVTDRGQVSIPSGIRQQFGIKSHAQLAWMALGNEIKVVVLPDNILESLTGCLRQYPLVEALLEDRQRDKERE